MSIRIGIALGLGLPAPLSAKEYWRWVELCEASGVDSIWHSDQLLGPTPEPMIMLAALAARTKRLRFGTNALALAFRDPLVVAKECATIDYLSQGRLLPIFGIGNSVDPVWTATGRSTKRRGQRTNEAITLIRRLLTEDDVTFHGVHFHYQGARLQLRPLHPLPLWIGGDSEAAIERTAALGDGWLGGLVSPVRAGEIAVRIKRALALTGRSIEDDHYGVTLPFRFGDLDDPGVEAFRRSLGARTNALPGDLAVGDASAIADRFRLYVEAGISKFVALPIATDADDLLAQTRHLADKVLPRVENA